MGTTGLIFAAIAIAWLAYLVPLSVRRRSDDFDELDPSHRFSESMRIVRYGTAPLLDQDLEQIGSIEVSTPLTRRAAVEDLRRLEKIAARRRRRVLVALMFALTAVLSLSAFALTPWWAAAIPGGLLVTFLVLARMSVRGMRRHLDARYAAIKQGSDEATVFLSRSALANAGEVKSGKADQGRTDVAAKQGRLWDPVPITVPTYVSKPLAPRTVRTIDLSSPEIASATRLDTPVTADAPERAADRPADTGGGELPAAASA
ncbi:MAG TPA: hypothetical protein VFP89_06565 [Propionibacteriaceae bacterium]|nr:hypothetical protein [Propionibacteriaceae bacterium]